MTDADNPASEPKNSPSAGAKSPELIPCRYINGNTSATFGLLRHHGAMIELLNRHRSPVPSSTRLSLTLGAVISIGPAPGREHPRLGVPVADHQPVTVRVAFVRQGGDVAVRLGLERRGQHPPRSFPADLVQPERQLRAGVLIGNYSQHRRSFLAGAGNAGLLFGQRGRYAASPIRWPIHKFWL